MPYELGTFDGTIVAQYAVTDATAETAFVLGELYRCGIRLVA
ncbi:hypothetical protein [Streptomyces sp. Qhu_M48]